MMIFIMRTYMHDRLYLLIHSLDRNLTKINVNVFVGSLNSSFKEKKKENAVVSEVAQSLIDNVSTG